VGKCLRCLFVSCVCLLCWLFIPSSFSCFWGGWLLGLYLTLSRTQVQLPSVSVCSTLFGAASFWGGGNSSYLDFSQHPCWGILLPWWKLFALISAYFCCVRVRPAFGPMCKLRNGTIVLLKYPSHPSLCVCVFVSKYLWFPGFCGFSASGYSRLNPGNMLP